MNMGRCPYIYELDSTYLRKKLKKKQILFLKTQQSRLHIIKRKNDILCAHLFSLCAPEGIEKLHAQRYYLENLNFQSF